jgi:hypothetical protein
MSCRRFAVLAVIAFLLSGFGAPSGGAYTQSGAGNIIFNLIPMGHEWVTRMAAIELLGYTPLSDPDMPDKNDPRKVPIPWTQGLAKNRDISSAGAQAEVARIKARLCAVGDDACQRYVSRYMAVYDAIVGERWVDIGGYNLSKGKLPWATDCLDAVTQEPAELQYDHFMRRYDDREGAGGVAAAQISQQRFIKYFVAAAMAPPKDMIVWDGGGYSDRAEVDRNYFLFGRAAHLFEDSFSSEHTVRIPTDNYVKVRQVKSYLCAAGSEQHSHPTLTDWVGPNAYYSGDVVWKPGTGWSSSSWSTYKASNMKNTTPGGNGKGPGDGAALVAVEATIDLWAAFIRTMGTPVAQRESVAQAEATTLVNNWLSYNQQEMQSWYDNQANRDDTYVLGQGQSGKGQTVQACMAGLKVGTNDQLAYVRQLEKTQKQCLYSSGPEAGYSDLFDPSLHNWYNWEWLTTFTLPDPPSNWTIPDLPADSGIPLRIRSVANQQSLSAPDGIANNAWVYAKPGNTLDFLQVGTNQDSAFRVTNAARLFLSYRLVPPDGAVKLFDPNDVIDPTNYITSPAGPAWSIESIAWNKYMWLDSGYQSPYISGTGDPKNANSQWYLDESGPTALVRSTLRSADPVGSLVYNYWTSRTIVSPNAGFAPAGAASFQVFSYPVPGTVPVYQFYIRMHDSAGTQVPYYSTNPQVPPNFTGGYPVFWVYSGSQPGAVAVNVFTSHAQDFQGGTQLYYYSSVDDAPAGYVKGSVAFWALPQR